jgi:hypothetical protein
MQKLIFIYCCIKAVVVLNIHIRSTSRCLQFKGPCKFWVRFVKTHLEGMTDYFILYYYREIWQFSVTSHIHLHDK